MLSQYQRDEALRRASSLLNSEYDDDYVYNTLLKAGFSEEDAKAALSELTSREYQAGQLRKSSDNTSTYTPLLRQEASIKPTALEPSTPRTNGAALSLEEPIIKRYGLFGKTIECQTPLSLSQIEDSLRLVHGGEKPGLKRAMPNRFWYLSRSKLQFEISSLQSFDKFIVTTCKAEGIASRELGSDLTQIQLNFKLGNAMWLTFLLVLLAALFIYITGARWTSQEAQTNRIILPLLFIGLDLLFAVVAYFDMKAVQKLINELFL